MLSFEGDVFSFGWGADCALGHGDEQSQLAPRRVEALDGVRVGAVCAGLGFSLALGREGALYSWGANSHYQCGHCEDPVILPPAMVVARPTLVESVRSVRLAGVSAGDLHMLAFSREGVAYSSGSNARGQAGKGLRLSGDGYDGLRAVGSLEGLRVSAVAAGALHSLVVMREGGLYAFGEGGQGRLGLGDEDSRTLPAQVTALAGLRVVAVSAGDEFSLALASDGRVFSFGRGRGGPLGHGGDADELLPRALGALAGVRVRAVVAGNGHSLAVGAPAFGGGSPVFSWGGHAYYRAEDLPIHVPGLAVR